jgi:butyrate kinase
VGEGHTYILAINPGSTSTKAALYDGEKLIRDKTIRHAANEFENCDEPFEQKEIRLRHVCGFMDECGLTPDMLAAAVGRGGIISPVGSGTYRVNQKMLQDLTKGAAASHVSALGGIIAAEIAARTESPIPAFVVDPVVVDELEPVARLSGIPGIQRASIFHALNTKAVAKEYADKAGKAYTDSNLVVAHLGGGISVGAHRHGKVVDVNNAIDGEGPFSPERSGGVPLRPLVKMCFSGEYTEKEILDYLGKSGGMMAYLGQNDFRAVTAGIEKGDEKARLVVDAMAYQVSKEIGAMAVVLHGRPDAIILTGGLAYSEYLTSKITDYVRSLAPVHVYPGEDELHALAAGTLRVLKGQETALEYTG